MRNIDKYIEDIDKLCATGKRLMMSMYFETTPIEAEKAYRVRLGDKYEEVKKKMPSFKFKYQEWYSESKVLIKQLLPDRFEDFVKAYEKPRLRKNVEYGNYVIEDYLIGLSVTKATGDVKVGPSAAVPVFQQQLSILESVKARFESRLFNIEQLVQADLFDSEVEVAKQLSKNKLYRAAGVICGVVLEKHLKQVCIDHTIKVAKSKPTINDLNELLKKEDVIDTGTWRNIQRLGDLRNLCSHNGEREPNNNDLEDLINGVERIIKKVF
ncbi:HEPN domain-containing protein [Sphingobacterium sp. UGAL515B_05]|uniref:HEPN domain-containing protein n=1 Tax=Sphingobacterium sp. UGAL515B_05 TaxID=2986767 RepID=UPI002954D6A6|nr:HEPN domain-containing protein [Sphingobacterium sp. UGAL515B_05]WON93645.1 HEPN domain-containing protein [Sphingobacterium sp. UGAL515B_05]